MSIPVTNAVRRLSLPSSATKNMACPPRVQKPGSGRLSSLLSLPPEIRAAIFTYVIGPTIISLERALYKVQRFTVVDEAGSALRLTCKQFYIETLPQFCALIRLEFANGIRPPQLSISIQRHYIKHIRHLTLRDAVIDELELKEFPNLQNLRLQTFGFSYRTNLWPAKGEHDVIRGALDAPCKQVMLNRCSYLTKASWLKCAIENPTRTFAIAQTAIFTLPPHRHRGWNQRRLRLTWDVDTGLTRERMLYHASPHGQNVLAWKGGRVTLLPFPELTPVLRGSYELEEVGGSWQIARALA